MIFWNRVVFGMFISAAKVLQRSFFSILPRNFRDEIFVVKIGKFFNAATPPKKISSAISTGFSGRQAR